ncbi:MAG TPA: CHAT domain-containing protein [Terriglobales bacterium]|jgi:CHAT domain-containing protein/Tfp pilus assembly protein PilF|nr:CHAT domain-containing protein [Terriglobales bacterium]
MSLRQKTYLVLLLLSCLASTVRVHAQLKPGVVIEEVAKYSEGEKAELREGDILLRWTRGEDKGEITSPFDLSLIEIEQAQRGRVSLEGLRGSAAQSWFLGPDDWGITARPNLPQDLVSIYLEGKELAKVGKLNEATEHWRKAGVQAQMPSSNWLSAWFFLRSADLLSDARQWKESDESFEVAVRQATEAGPAIAAQVLYAWATTFRRRSDWAHAEKYYQETIAQCRKLGAENLMMALSLSSLGDMAHARGDQTKAEQYHLQALAIRQKLAPDSLSVASSLHNLSAVAEDHGDLAKEEEYVRRALTIRERLAPESLHLAQSFNQFGDWYWVRGDLPHAEEYFHRAFVIRKKLAPESLDFAISLNNLGIIAEMRSDLDGAEHDYSQALAIQEKLEPGGLNVARSLHNLGDIAQDRGDLAAAEQDYRRALAIHEKIAPDNDLVPLALNNLGELARTRDDLTLAQECHIRALQAARRISPDNVYVAISLYSLGRIADDHGELVKAEDYYLQALALFEKISPDANYYGAVLTNLGIVREERADLGAAGKYYDRALAVYKKFSSDSLDVARVLQHIGNLAQMRGDLDKAENYHRQALAVLERVAPGSSSHAETLASLAGIMRRKQRVDDAAQFYEQALNAFESQTAHLGGSEETRSGFRSKHARFYNDYIDLLIAEKKPALAFQVLEHFHARSLFETLSNARIDIRKGVEPALVARERALQQSLISKSNRRIQLLNDQHTEEQLAVLNQEMKDILEQYQDVEAQIRISSPLYAALTQPEPLSATEVQQQLLDDDTALLEYSLGEDRSYVFVVTSRSLEAYELPPRTKIEAAARRLYHLLRTWQTVNATGKSNPSSSKSNAVLPHRETYVQQAAMAFSQMVLAPVAAQLKARRLLIVSDGALQYIPFAVLPAPAQSGASKPRYSSTPAPLILEHEIIKLPSASVLGVLRQQTATRREPAKAVAVLADPVFDKNDDRVQVRLRYPKTNRLARSAEQGAASKLGSAQQLPAQDQDEEPQQHLTRSLMDVLGHTKRGVSLARLPYTRREAQFVLAMVPAGQGMEALDFNASRATAISPDLGQYHVVHFATHGLLDSKHPELSGLVLSLVDQHGSEQNGFLGLQEIYNLSLPVDLVVLSACETGLGKEIKGEGLMSLTRGFMYAGASRVMASLWKVDDVATAELMRRFYRGIEQERMRPAAALQKAQIEMWKRPRWRDPYYWAAFELQGEWN